MSGGGGMKFDCEACGAEPFEPCREWCIAKYEPKWYERLQHWLDFSTVAAVLRLVFLVLGLIFVLDGLITHDGYMLALGVLNLWCSERSDVQRS